MKLDNIFESKSDVILDNLITENNIKEVVFENLDRLIESYLTEKKKKKKPKTKEEELKKTQDKDKKSKKRKKTWFEKDNAKFLHKLGVSDTDEDTTEHEEDKLRTVKELLSDPKLNGAEIARQLWNLSPDEEDAARSLFSKKRRGFENDNGHEYGFTPVEVNRLYSILTAS